MADAIDGPSFEKKRFSSLFDLVIDPTNVQKVYMPGETLTGTIQILGKTNIQVDIFSVSIVGEYYTIDGDNEVSEVFSSESSLLDIKGGGEGMAEVPFSLNIKPEVPASIATPYGGIRYKVVGTVMAKDPNGGVKAIEKSIHLSVIAPKQIENDKAGKRVYVDDGSCLCCCFGMISADLEISEISLLCGSRAIINARIINSTKRPIPMTAIILVQKIIRKKDMRWFKHEVGKIERGSIMPGRQQVWLSERFLIPPLPPTRSDAYFDVSYTFVMTIQKSSSKTIRLKAPITIGNIMGMDLPKNWRDPDGKEFWSYGDEETMKVSNLPVYVSYCF